MLSCHDNTSGRGDPPNPRTPAVRKEAARHLVEGWREDLAGGIPRTPARQPCARRPPDIWSRAGARISPGGSPEPPHASRAQGGRPTFGRGLARGSRPAPERASGPRWARRMPTAPGGSSGRCARPPRSGLRDAERPERPKPWRPLRLRGVTGGTAPRQPLRGRTRSGNRETLPRNPPRAARNGGGRAVAGKLLDLLVASLTDGEGEQADPSLLGDGGALPAPPAFRPTRTTRTPRRPAIVALRRSYDP